MIIINFSHPLTVNQKIELSALLQADRLVVVDVKAQFRMSDGFEAQASAMLDTAKLSAEQIEAGCVLMLPALSAGAAAVIAEWHGRYGHFPTIIRLKSTGDVLPEWKVAEVLPLQKVRSRARARR